MTDAREHVRMNFVSILFRNGFVYDILLIF